MYNSVEISRYYDVNSSMHKLNPINKIICFLIFTIIVLIEKDLPLMLILSVLLINMILMSNIKIKVFLNEISKIKYFLLILFVFNAIIKLPIDTNVLILLKIVLITLYSSMFLLTTSVNSIMYGFNVLLSPLKVFGIKVYDITVMIALVITFIPNILEEALRIIRTISLRGLDYKTGSIKDKIKIFKLMFIPMFNLSFKKSDDLADVLDVRLYNSSNKRSCYKKYSFNLTDLFILFTHILIIVAIVLKEVIL